MTRWPCAAVVAVLLTACSGPGTDRTVAAKASTVREIPSARSVQTSVFRDVAAETGLNFTHDPGLTGEHYMPEIMGSGVAVLDYDNDGDLDVFLVQAGSLKGQSRKGGNRLFRNELKPTGKLRFSDVSTTAGVDTTGYGMGVATGDYDNDGRVDLYVTNFGSNALLRNNGDGTFQNVTEEAGADDPRWSSSAMFFDYDRDGWLDLFVANYLDFTPATNKPCYSSARERDYCNPKAYGRVPNRLLRNLGNGKFADVTGQTGLFSAYGPGLGVVAGDVNNDGFLDVYVANDGQANQLWLNEGGVRFEDIGLMSASAVNANGQAQAGMGVSLDDFDNDGDEDIFVTNLSKETNTLYRNDGTGMFDDATERLGLGQPSFAMTGFGAQWFDFDNDGFLDMFVANGAVTIDETRRGKSAFPYEQRNQLFHNEMKSGKTTFAEVTGGALELFEVSRGAAFGDIDNDGDIDIVVSNNNGPARLLLNEQTSGNHWLKVRLSKAGRNRQGIGARVGVRLPDGKMIWRRARTDGSYLSASAPDVHFGLGQKQGPVDVEVEWLSGPSEVWKRVPADRLMTLVQGQGTRR